VDKVYKLKNHFIQYFLLCLLMTAIAVGWDFLFPRTLRIDGLFDIDLKYRIYFVWGGQAIFGLFSLLSGAVALNHLLTSRKVILGRDSIFGPRCMRPGRKSVKYSEITHLNFKECSNGYVLIIKYSRLGHQKYRLKSGSFKYEDGFMEMVDELKYIGESLERGRRDGA
jgi:hypothetical protein